VTIQLSNKVLVERMVKNLKCGDEIYEHLRIVPLANSLSALSMPLPPVVPYHVGRLSSISSHGKDYELGFSWNGVRYKCHADDTVLVMETR
jgi:hypothetical protein